METYTFSEFELLKYYREHGLYAEEIKQWPSVCISANDRFKNNKANLEEDLKKEKSQKSLLKDLRRKEKALAETATLLVFRKKLDKILGENEED